MKPHSIILPFCALLSFILIADFCANVESASISVVNTQYFLTILYFINLQKNLYYNIYLLIYIFEIILIIINPFAQNIPAERAKLQRQRQQVQQQIQSDRQMIAESDDAESQQAAQQSLDAHQRQLELIQRRLARLQQLEEADNQAAQNFG